MGPRPRDVRRDDAILKLTDKLTRRESQLGLLNRVGDNKHLQKTRILPSIRPRVGKHFEHRDLEQKKDAILLQARTRILEECAVPEAKRDIDSIELRISRALNRYDDLNRISKLMDEMKDRTKKVVLKRLEEKVSFHLDQKHQITPKPVNIGRAKSRNRKTEQKRAEKKRYKKKRQAKKLEWMERHVEQNIKGKLVMNMSSEDVPDIAYMYLAKGLNFVEAQPIKTEDLTFDTKEFLRKMEWKAFYHQLPANDDVRTEEKDVHSNLRIRSRKHPLDFHHPLFDEIKTKIMGMVANMSPTKPKSNLTDAEQRGKGWILDAIEKQKIFVTRADKGGAILIMDYQTVIESVKSELEKENKFEKLSITVEEKMNTAQKKVKETVLKYHQKNTIPEEDKKRITGINNKGNMMHAPEFKPTVPYAYPLYKVHKLNSQQIKNKTVPPVRLVHATRDGPLYRLEKYVSPYLTAISRKYCEQEFILDTPDIISHIENYNKELLKKPRMNLQLFTLDVIALYPSIKPELALAALQDACSMDTSYSDDMKEAICEFSELIFKESFITFQGEAYISKEGIPTGNCVSRQMADCTMHWLLFKQIKHRISSWTLIEFWKRFIDDVFGVWMGTARQFTAFVETLNKLAEPFGIKFGDSQIGKSVHFLDLTLEMDQDNQIQYRLYRKDTDARLYLRTDSFHPHHVFDSVAFSQMIRVIERNSQDHTCVEDLSELKEDLEKCGHNSLKLDKTEPKAVLRVIQNLTRSNKSTDNSSQQQSLVFSLQHSPDNDSLKKLVRELEGDIKRICGDVRIVFATRKHSSIGNKVVKNKQLGEVQVQDQPHRTSQRCYGRGCKTCPLLFEFDERISVNGLDLQLDRALTCKDKGVIYVAQCQICCKKPASAEDTYFGQTVTPFHIRINGHRSKFSIDDRKLYEKSALSMHCFIEHKDKFDLKLFKLGLVRKTKPTLLDREESRFCIKFKTNVWGLNRMEIKT